MSCLPPQSYADGSQYMASHDSLSPPYTNSRVTGMVQAKCVCMGTCIFIYLFIFTIYLFLAISFRFTALSGPDCVCVCLRRISETLAYTGGDRSSGMQFLSLSLSSLGPLCGKTPGSVCSFTHDALCLWLSSMWRQL